MTVPLKTGSICSGVGGLDRGLHRAGFTDLRWACEKVPHRRAVLRRHWGAELVIHDDLTKLDPADLEPVDLLVGGTPCPDFSHAKAVRAGLAGDQSKLFYDFMRVRDHLEPDWTLWENVDGALTSNEGLDFALVLGAFVGARVHVPRGGWSSAGVVSGPWGGAVWRVLDAQHFGTPQRRNRVFVVGRLGGPCPPEILLEPARRGGDPSSRDEAPQDVARVLGERVAGTLGAIAGRGGASRHQVVDGHGAYVAAGQPVVIAPGVAHTLVSSGSGRVDPLDGNLVFMATGERGEGPAAFSADRAGTLGAGGAGGAGSADPGQIVVPFRKAQKAHDGEDSERWEPADVAGTLAAGGGDASATLAVTVPTVACPLTTAQRDGDANTTYVIPFELAGPGSTLRQAARPADVACTLRSASSGAGTTQETVPLLLDGVRRLTPTECERIQGLPDGWTIPFGPGLLDVPAWHDLGPGERAAGGVPWDPPARLDTPRRSACGDAVNAAVAEWIGRRLLAMATGREIP